MNLELTKGELLDLIHQTIDANGMETSDDVHVRLVVSRGLKDTPHQNPRATIGVSAVSQSEVWAFLNKC
jgi:branched-chain amino acid aminotransferase